LCAISRGISMNARGVVKWLPVAALLTCWSGLALAGPLGELEIRGDVHLTQLGSSETLTLRNTTYVLFAGDRVATGNGPASLRMGAGNSLAIGPHSELILSMGADGLQADLSRGSLTYLLSDNGRSVQVNGGERLTAGRLGVVELSETGSLRQIQGPEAEGMAADLGLSVSDSDISVACENLRSCGNFRPRSISP
jgi:hypothetical protein